MKMRSYWLNVYIRDGWTATGMAYPSRWDAVQSTPHPLHIRDWRLHLRVHVKLK